MEFRNVITVLSIVLLSIGTVRSVGENADMAESNGLTADVTENGVRSAPPDESMVAGDDNDDFISSRSAPSYGYYQQYQTPAYRQNIKTMYAGQNYSYSTPIHGAGYNTANLYEHSVYGYNQSIQSPYQNLPGTYQKDAYNTNLYFSGNHYNAQDVYSSYLVSGAYEYYSAKCGNHYGQTPKITQADLDAAFDYAHHKIRSYGQHYVNSSAYPSYSPPLLLKEKEAILMEYVTEYFAKYKCLSKYQTTTFLPSVNIGRQYMGRNKYGDTSCYSSYGSKKGWALRCTDSKYRTIDGSCNNLRHPYWGKSYVCHIRLVPPNYSDGVSAPRRAIDGKPLPSARTVSNVITADKPFESFYTNMKVAFGQFVNHDITHTPVHGSYALSSSYSGPVDCCKSRKNKQCYPIDITPSPYDYQYRQYNNTCLNFVRSAPCPLCELGPRQQLNIGTSFIDAGTVYGSTTNDSAALRTYKLGLLRTSKDIYGKPILPDTAHPYQNECSPPIAGMKCFTAGDQRCNQHPSLLSMHNVVLREHNRIAMALYSVNPHWNDETLFQQTRRVVIAEIQHITYNEYLPIIFGNTLMNYYSLKVSHQGYTTYEPYTDPTSWNDYATAACRFGHTQIRGHHTVLSKQGAGYNSSDSYWLRDRYMDPSYLWNGKIDGLLKGLVSDHSYSVDPFFTNDVKNYLLRPKHLPFGSDLIARNIQRGRDHGLPSYVTYLKYCFGYKVESWDDIKAFIPEPTVNILKHLYGSYENLDLYIAGVSERHFPDADVGPTFACILGIQYYHLKFGDRYFYEHGGQSGSFNLVQLENIRKTTTLSRLLCRASDYMDAIQPHSFFPVSKYNKELPCKSYPEINWLLWKESPQYGY